MLVVMTIHRHRIRKKNCMSRRVSGELSLGLALGKDIDETPLNVWLEVISFSSKIAGGHMLRLEKRRGLER